MAMVAVTVAVGLGRKSGYPAVTRLCAWCENPIPARARRDAVCCSVRCRQARHRFLRAAGYAEQVTGRPFPGLTMVGVDCVAEDLPTVLDAIKRTEATVQPATLRWLRDNP